jgi:hypothetical protein
MEDSLCSARKKPLGPPGRKFSACRPEDNLCGCLRDNLWGRLEYKFGGRLEDKPGGRLEHKLGGRLEDSFCSARKKPLKPP